MLRTASVLLTLLLTAPARAEIVDYLLIFAGDATPYRATRAHTFATLVRVEENPCQPPCLVEATTLSWLPTTLKIHAMAFGPEEGHLFTLEETLAFHFDSGGRVSLWGPYRIQPELREAFQRRIAELCSGRCRYKGVDLLRGRQVCCCVRALEEMLPTRRRLLGGFGYGEVASGTIVLKWTPYLINPEQTHPWVETLIGLDAHPIIHRAYGEKATHWDQVRSFFGRE